MRIAAAAYPLEWLESWAAYRARLTRWVEAAAGADLLVFPEYAAMELCGLAGAAAADDVEQGLQAVADRLEEADAIHADLACEFGVHILAGSGPAHGAPARPVNRARLFGPEGPLGAQDKMMPTRVERELFDIAPGARPRIFDTALGRIGVLICYDAEFPLMARWMVEAGAKLLLVPSCTRALAGYWRVRIGAQARALEGQCVAVHAPLVGESPWCRAIPESTGSAAIYGPPDLGFPDTGVLAEGASGQPGWVFAEVDLASVARVRREGRVLNMAHWPEQAGHLRRAEDD